jgi:hypothetical protein
MLSLVVIWQWIHPRQLSIAPSPVKTAEVHPASARPSAPAKAAPIQTKVPVAAQAKPTAPQPAVASARPAPAKPTVTPQVTPPPMAPPIAPQPIPAAAKPVVSPTTVATEPAPKPVQLNVQAIVFNPTRPSAVINGRTLFLGDHISDFRVAAISQRTVTVVKPGKTNVLVLRD